MSLLRKLTSLCAAMILSSAAVAATDRYEPCGTLKTGYGPFDYRTQKRQLEIVERFHFGPDIEFPSVNRKLPLGAPLDYTLHASPNHHRALAAIAKLELRLKAQSHGHVSRKEGLMKGADYAVPCYFDRALRFAPDDGMVRVIYAQYLLQSGDKANAMKQIEIARKLDDNDANMQYNLGLLLFDVKDYDNAAIHAKKAYGLGWELPGLREKLQKVGKWP